jgi:hypothetical protein
MSVASTGILTGYYGNSSSIGPPSNQSSKQFDGFLVETTATAIISGTAVVGTTLTASHNISDPLGVNNLTYQWSHVVGGVTTHILGATNSTHTLTQEHFDKTIIVRVSYTTDAGEAKSVTSAATLTVALPPNTLPTGMLTITGTAQVGQTLTANTGSIIDPDVIGAFGFALTLNLINFIELGGYFWLVLIS